VRHESVGAYGESARNLNRIRKSHLETSSNPCGTFSNIGGEFDNLPRLHDIAVTTRKRLLPLAERPSENLRHCNRRHRKDDLTGRLPIKQRPESCSESRVMFEKVDDWRAVY